MADVFDFPRRKRLGRVRVLFLRVRSVASAGDRPNLRPRKGIHLFDRAVGHFLQEILFVIGIHGFPRNLMYENVLLKFNFFGAQIQSIYRYFCAKPEKRLTNTAQKGMLYL